MSPFSLSNISTPVAKSAQPPESIVVVDDTPENLQLLATMLSEQGYHVRLASSGERALATIQKERPHLILLDVLMPDMDGYEVCRRLKQSEDFRDIPVIFISALSDVFDKVKAFAIGGVDYITKPFQIEEVLARVETHLKLEEMRRQLNIQNQQLQEQNHELEAFAHTVAHDLKAPLSMLVGALSLLQEEFSPDLVRMCMNGSFKMASIIDELLLLSSVRKENVPLDVFSMDDVVVQVITRLTAMINESKAEIHLPTHWDAAIGYQPWVEEILANYMSNAMKYGGEPPIIFLKSTVLPDGMIRFAVEDNGKGLSAEAQAALFTEFTRLDKTRAQGHGLGLSIVRRITDKLDGRCGVTSALGKGSVFYFDLPASH